MNEGRDYEIVPAEEGLPHTNFIKLLHKRYKGAIIRVGVLKFGEEDESGRLPLNFDFDIMERNGVPVEYFAEDKFNNYLGDILFSILEDQINQGLDQVKPEEMFDEIREDFVEEPDMERSLRTKSSAVRKR